jgi:hypothetical protein
MLKIILEIQTTGRTRRVEFVDESDPMAYSLGVMIGEAVTAIETEMPVRDNDFLDHLVEGITAGLPCHITGICKDEQ